MQGWHRAIQFRSPKDGLIVDPKEPIRLRLSEPGDPFGISAWEQGREWEWERIAELAWQRQAQQADCIHEFERQAGAVG